MCGIIGFNWEDKALLKKGMKETKHRGPDASGTLFDKGISLGHNRLSIIDLSNAGKQPLSNEEGDIWVVFNGEIYNYKDLKAGLHEKHDFVSGSDTEVLVHLYEDKGIDMVKYLQGMFAFCIYDSKKKILFLARDRAGKKPLYYYNKDKKFIFCSEIKGILQDEEIKREVNKEALEFYLIHRANTGEETFFKGIKKLQAGNILVYDLKNNKTIIEKYWDFAPNIERKSIEEYTKELHELLDDSIKCRLMSDVPFGAFLSGGIDSGTIVSIMNKYVDEKVKTFSVGFDDKEQTETNEARFLADSIGTDHHELLIDNNSIKNLPEIVYQGDEPMADPTAIPTYFLSKYAKKYCTVVLTGEGADEIFAGYPQYKFMKIHDRIISKLPKFSRKLIVSTVKNIPKSALDKGFRFASSLGEKGLDRFSNFVISNDKSEQYLNLVSIFNNEEQKELYNFKGNIYNDYANYFENSKKKVGGVVTKAQRLDFNEPMVDDLLMKIDKNMMAFGIEGRSPFLDYRIIELAARMPESMKLQGFSKDKFILRKIASTLVPKQTSQRKKRHFFVPIDSWFKNELSSLKSELFDEKFIKNQGIFNTHYINKMSSGFAKSSLFYSRQLWSLMVFQIWYKQYIENEKVRI